MSSGTRYHVVAQFTVAIIALLIARISCVTFPNTIPPVSHCSHALQSDVERHFLDASTRPRGMSGESGMKDDLGSLSSSLNYDTLLEAQNPTMRRIAEEQDLRPTCSIAKDLAFAEGLGILYDLKSLWDSFRDLQRQTATSARQDDGLKQICMTAYIAELNRLSVMAIAAFCDPGREFWFKIDVTVDAGATRSCITLCATPTKSSYCGTHYIWYQEEYTRGDSHSWSERLLSRTYGWIRRLGAFPLTHVKHCLLRKRAWKTMGHGADDIG